MNIYGNHEGYILHRKTTCKGGIFIVHWKEMDTTKAMFNILEKAHMNIYGILWEELDTTKLLSYINCWYFFNHSTITPHDLVIR